MKRLILTLVVAALVLPPAALAKGPSAATMDGPGGGGMSFSGDEGSGPLGELTQQAGFFPAVFGQEPNPMLAGRPKGNLGPKYTITYTVPGGDGDVFTIRQDVYPYADPAPVTYLAPDQKVFDMTTHGGWFQADPELRTTLVSAGLPANPHAGSSSDGSSFPTTTAGLLAFALLLVLGTGLLLRRRARPAAA